MEAPSKAFLLFFLLPDWLKLNLKSRMECGFSDIFSCHICSTEAKTIGVANYAASFGAKNVQKTTFEAAKMMLGPWNQQVDCLVGNHCACLNVVACFECEFSFSFWILNFAPFGHPYIKAYAGQHLNEPRCICL